MIPFTVPAWLTVRVVIWIGIVAVVALMGWRVQTWHDGYLRAEATEKALATSRKKLRQCTASQTAAALAYEEAVRRAESVAAADRVTTERNERELQTKLAAADAGARDLARRLRDYQAGRCGRAVPLASVAPTELAGTAGEPGDAEVVERAAAEHFAACGRDSARLAGWITWWGEVKAGRAEPAGRQH